MSVECLNQYRQAERMFETFVKRIQVIAECRPESKVKIYNLAAHALHSACRSLSIPIKANDFSMFDEEELKFLMAYDRHLEKNAKVLAAAERKMHADAKAAEEKAIAEKVNSVAPPSPKKARATMAKVNGPRDPSTLARERQARKDRLAKLQKVAGEDQVIVESDTGQISSLMLL